MTDPNSARVRILGEPVDLVTPAELMSFAARRVTARQKGLVLNKGSKGLAAARRDPDVRAAYDRADLTPPDAGLLTVWGRLTGKADRRRARGADYPRWRDDFWRIAAQNGWKVFLLGSPGGQAAATATQIQARWQGVTTEAADAEGSDGALAAAINAFAPDVILADMEVEALAGLIARLGDAIESGVMISAEGALGFEAGGGVERRRSARRFGDRLALVPSMGRDLLDMLEYREEQSSGMRLY
jgi:N-acetylglucosaminyldiphosphoundecaprenol N-acetyl-beta-D-mannosaminyltransferase